MRHPPLNPRAVSTYPYQMDTAQPNDSPLKAAAPQLGRSRVPSADFGHEYEVVRLRFDSLLVSYVCFFLLFGWFRFYWTFIREGWFWATVGGVLITAFGTLNAVRARRKHRTFPALVALLLNGGLLISVTIPPVAFYVVYRLLGAR